MVRGVCRARARGGTLGRSSPLHQHSAGSARADRRVHVVAGRRAVRGEGLDGSDAQEAVWNNPACGCASRSGPCGDCCILGRFAPYFQYFPSRGAVRFDVELHLFRHRHPHVAPLSPRTPFLSCGDRITAVPGVVHFARGPALFPFVHGYRSCRFSRLPVSSEGTSAAAQWPLNRSSVTGCCGCRVNPMRVLRES
jgi:hypothetical protein